MVGESASMGARLRSGTATEAPQNQEVWEGWEVCGHTMGTGQFLTRVKRDLHFQVGALFENHGRRTPGVVRMSAAQGAPQNELAEDPTGSG